MIICDGTRPTWLAPPPPFRCESDFALPAGLGPGEEQIDRARVRRRESKTEPGRDEEMRDQRVELALALGGSFEALAGAVARALLAKRTNGVAVAPETPPRLEQ